MKRKFYLNIRGQQSAFMVDVLARFAAAGTLEALMHSFSA
jgi:hypothetical protein